MLRRSPEINIVDKMVQFYHADNYYSQGKLASPIEWKATPEICIENLSDNRESSLFERCPAESDERDSKTAFEAAEVYSITSNQNSLVNFDHSLLF